MKTNEQDIRNILKPNFFEPMIAQDPTLIILDEFGLGGNNTFVDTIVIGDVLTGYEIKSDLDNLKRLPYQIKEYEKSLSYCHLITVRKHLDPALSLLPDHWGVILIEFNQVLEYRKAAENINIQGTELIKIIWKRELIELCKVIGLKIKYIHKRGKTWLQHRILRELTVCELTTIIPSIIRERKDKGWDRTNVPFC